MLGGLGRDGSEEGRESAEDMTRGGGGARPRSYSIDGVQYTELPLPFFHPNSHYVTFGSGVPLEQKRRDRGRSADRFLVRKKRKLSKSHHEMRSQLEQDIMDQDDSFDQEKVIELFETRISSRRSRFQNYKKLN